jgi:hypothetical protein
MKIPEIDAPESTIREYLKLLVKEKKESFETTEEEVSMDADSVMFVRKSLEKAIKDFGGEFHGMERFTEAMELFFESILMTKAAKVLSARTKLKGQAVTWAKKATQRGLLGNWRSFQKGLEGRFTNRDQERLELARLDALTYAGKVKEYIGAF